MSGDVKTKGEKNITVKDVSGSTVNIYPPQSNDDKKSSFVPQHISIQSLTPPSYFTGREKVLEDIDEALYIHRTAALYGISGLGKSSVVYKFAEQRAADYQYVIFVRADRLGFDANFDKTCEMMSLVFDAQDNEDTKAAKFQNKIDELCANLPANKRLLLIFDNVDETERLRKFLPQHNKANILLTSNFPDVYDLGHRVWIDNLSESDAMLLLHRKASASDADNFDDIATEELEATKQIAHLLGFHPFALSIAGLYIRKKRKSFAQYLARLRQSQGKILKDEKGADAYQHGTIYVAFEIPFNAIAPSENIPAEEKDEVEITRECLKIASILAADNMPEEIFRETVSLIFPHQAEFIADEDNWDNIYERLSLYGLFERNPSTATFSLHRLFRLFLDNKLKNERQIIEEPLAKILSDNFERFEFDNKEKVERYLSHVGVFLDYLKEDKADDKTNLRIENESTALLCNNYARYFEQYGQYGIAEKYYELSKDICEGKGDIDQTWTATSYNNLAALYDSQGRYEEAELLYRQSLVIREKILGENHFSTATSYNNLALLYDSQGRYEEAEPLYKQSLTINEKILGENHPNTGGTYNNLAALYDSQGRYEEAELLYKQSLVIREKTLGENHPDTATSYNNLAGFYFERGNLKLAKEYQRKSLKSRLANFGENHPDVAQSYWWLGVFSEKEEKYPEALDHFYKAREIYLRFLPEEHPRVQNLQNWIDKCERLIEK